MSSSSTSTPKQLHSFQPCEGAKGELFPNPKELTIDEEVTVAEELVALSDTTPSVGERKLRWNLRDRSSLQKASNPNMVGGPSSNTVLEKGKQPIKTEEALPKLPKLPKFSIELKPQEISDDIFAMTGKTIPKKVKKKKAKGGQNWIHQFFPGRSLETRRINHYKIFQDKAKEN